MPLINVKQYSQLTAPLHQQQKEANFRLYFTFINSKRLQLQGAKPLIPNRAPPLDPAGGGNPKPHIGSCYRAHGYATGDVFYLLFIKIN
jgi:hypothetical protein